MEMGSIRLIQKPQNGQIIFTVPDKMKDETIVIKFRPAKEELQVKGTTLAEAARELFAKLNRVKTDFMEEHYSVYEQ